MTIDFYHVLKNRREFSIQTEGESMYPLFHSGDIVHYRRTDFRKIRLNDVVLVKHNRQWFTHRVVYRNTRFTVVQGDNNPYPDGIIKPKGIIARAVGVTRNRQRMTIGEMYAAQASVYQAEITKLQKSFKKMHVEFVFLKGLPLYSYFFQSIPHRLLADCDILVNPADTTKIDTAFAENGFEKEENHYTPSFLEYMKQPPTEIGFMKTINGFPVLFDVHYEIAVKRTHFHRLKAQLRQFSGKALFNRQLISVDGQTYPIMADNDLIFFLLLHMANHFWGGFFRFDFLIQVLQETNRKKEIDWHAILQKAKTYGLINYIFPTLYYLHRFYGVNEPLEEYKKKYLHNYAYSKAILNLFFKNTTIATYNTFRWGRAKKTIKFLLRFLLYDKSLFVKTAQLLEKDFAGYAFYYLRKRYSVGKTRQSLRNRSSNDIGQQTTGPLRQKDPAS